MREVAQQGFHIAEGIDDVGKVLNRERARL
jgi:hypothetical protein